MKHPPHRMGSNAYEGPDAGLGVPMSGTFIVLSFASSWYEAENLRGGNRPHLGKGCIQDAAIAFSVFPQVRASHQDKQKGRFESHDRAFLPRLKAQLLVTQ